ncbi:hypothetical protein AB836_00955 [Rickettsiales bacterium (ex Bugula neritina AB1)]|nr:hypothetical protein AB836_00955 [Rickettsiales bacterium (ex Bugula neritina AB1)]
MKNLLKEISKTYIGVIKEVKKLKLPNFKEVLNILFWISILGVFLTLFLFGVSELIVPIIKYIF